MDDDFAISVGLEFMNPFGQLAQRKKSGGRKMHQLMFIALTAVDEQKLFASV